MKKRSRLGDYQGQGNKNTNAKAKMLNNIAPNDKTSQKDDINCHKLVWWNPLYE